MSDEIAQSNITEHEPIESSPAMRPRGRPVGTTGKHKKVKPEQKKLTIWLTHEQISTADHLGNGNVVAGIRKSLDAAKLLK